MTILTLNNKRKEYPFVTEGRIVYDPPRPGMKRNTDRWAIVSMDREITRYYRWWIKTHYHIDLCQPSWDAHISIVRGEHISKNAEALWRSRHGQKIQVKLGIVPKQVEAKPYFWYIDGFAPEIDEIRAELGLKSGFNYHLTVGRTYGENEYVRPAQRNHRY